MQKQRLELFSLECDESFESSIALLVSSIRKYFFRNSVKNLLLYFYVTYRAYYRGILKTKLVHRGILPEIQKFALETECPYVLIGRSALEYYGVSTLTDLIDILFDYQAKETIQIKICNIPKFKVNLGADGNISMIYRKIRIRFFFSKDEHSGTSPFPYFWEIPIENGSPFPICTIPAYNSISFIQAKLDHTFTPLGCMETLMEKKGLDWSANVYQFESIKYDLKKAITETFTRESKIHLW